MTVGAIGTRDASYDEAASVDDDARARFTAQQADEARKRADAEAQARLYAHYTSGTCAPATGVDGGTCGRDLPIHARTINTNDRAEVKRYADRLSVLEASPASSPVELAWLRTQAPALCAAQQKFAAVERAEAQHTYAVATVVRPNAKIDSFAALGSEIARLRGALGTPHDAALDAPIRARLADLQRKWVESAKASGMRVPDQNGIDARTATDAQIRDAMMWMEIGGVVPFGRLMQGGADAYRRELVEEAMLRRPGGLEALLALHQGDGATQKDLIARAMKRAGVDGTCHTGDTPQTMLVRYYAAIAAKQRAGDESVRAMPTLGHDGLVFANADDAERYRIAQTIAAANPGTTFGSIAASLRALSGGTLEEIRAAGEAGNMVEGLGGGVAPALGHGKQQPHFDTTRPPEVVAVLPTAQRPGMPRRLVNLPVPRPSGMDGGGVRVAPMVKSPTAEGIAKRDAASARWVADQRLPSGRHWSEATFEEFVAAFRARKPNDRTTTSDLRNLYDIGKRLDPDKNSVRDIRGAHVYATPHDPLAARDVPCSGATAYRVNGRAVTFADLQNRLIRAEQKWRAAKATRDELEKSGDARPEQLTIARRAVSIASKELGEMGSEAYVASRYPGPPPPELIFPPPEWSSEKDQFDRVYKISGKYGRTNLVVEAKGNRAEYGGRKADEGEVEQGTKRYLDETIAIMRNSSDPTIKRVGQELYEGRREISYVAVVTTGGTTTKIDGREFDMNVDTGVKPREPRK